MCEPTTIAIVTMAVISAATAVYSSNQQKHAVEDQLKVQQKQANEAASSQTEDRMRAAREARASARAASAESGASGNSVDAVLNDISFQEGRDVSHIEKNRENALTGTTQQARTASAEINGNLAQGLGQAVGQGMQAYGAYGSQMNLSATNNANTSSQVNADVSGYRQDLMSQYTIKG